eukprot:1498316-Prymnesium_polylepis.1
MVASGVCGGGASRRAAVLPVAASQGPSTTHFRPSSLPPRTPMCFLVFVFPLPPAPPEVVGPPSHRVINLAPPWAGHVITAVSRERLRVVRVNATVARAPHMPPCDCGVHSHNSKPFSRSIASPDRRLHRVLSDVYTMWHVSELRGSAE